MFTGIVETIGTVREFIRQPSGARVTIHTAGIAGSARVGDSLAVDGACLTVSSTNGSSVVCDLSGETLARTTLGGLRVGMRVNLERPLRLGDAVGGHLVGGHVDGVGHVVARTPQGDWAVFRVRFPEGLTPLLVPKGSVAVDGISLTIAALAGQYFEVAVIPYTLQSTTLGEKRPGAQVNLEADLIGKYVMRLAEERQPGPTRPGVTLSLLKEHGFT